MEYHVYAHLNPITLMPFYIGKGKNKRAYSKQDRSDHWKKYVAKHGHIPLLLVDGLTNEQACEIEKQYISKHRIKTDGGILINKTFGGEGGNTFDPVNGKNWNSGRTGVYSRAMIAKLRGFRTGKKLSAGTKEKVLSGLAVASKNSLISRTHKVKCLVTGKIWNNRNECIEDLKITLSAYKNRMRYNREISGFHLQIIK